MQSDPMVNITDMEDIMAKSSPDFSLEVEGVKGVCPAGEKHAKEMIAEGKIRSSPAKGRAYAERLPGLPQTSCLRKSLMPAVATRKRSWSPIRR